MDIGVDYIEPKTGITTDDLAKLMQDRVFVDYFNVYLSLPIFSQRLLYKFDDKDFEFDPPMKRRGQVLDRGKLIGWLLQERVPYFMTSELYLDYIVCRQLLETELKLTSSAHRLDYEEIYISEDRDILHNHLGHVLGMCQLRHYLAGSSGETVMEFCKDAERFRRVPPEQEKRQRFLFRLMQLKYFRAGAGFVCVEEPAVWQALNDSERAIDEVNSVLSWSCENSSPVPCNFVHLTTVLCGLLRSYWVPKFVIHCRQADLKTALSPGEHQVRSLSDLGVLKQLKDIDRTLALAQGNLQPSPRTREQKSGITWNALFPGCEVDDTFLTSNDDVVTLHPDGRVVLESLGSNQMMEELEYYTDKRVDLITPSSSEESSPGGTSTKSGKQNDGNVGHLPPLAGPSRRGETQLRPGSCLTAAIKRAVESRRGPAESRISSALRQSPLPALNERLDTSQKKSSATEGKRPNTSSDLRSPSSVKSWKLPQLPKRPRTQQTARGQADILTLPSIKEGTKQGTDRKASNQANARPTDMTCKRTLSIHPVPGIDATAHSKSAFRKANSYVINALAADQLAGGPLKTYVRGQSAGEVSLCLSFWQEAQTYLALQPAVADNSNITDHVRHRRARALVMRHLMATSQYHLPLPHTLQERLVHLLPKDEAGNLLRQAQDVVMGLISPLWKDYCRRDRDIFQQTMVTSRPGKATKSSTHTHGDHRRMVDDAADDLAPSDAAPLHGWTQQAGDHWPPVGGEPNYVEISERRAWRALQLAMDGLRLDPCSVGLEPLPLEELAYEAKTQEGSLTLKKLAIIRRCSLDENLAERRQKAHEAFKAHMARVRAQEILDSIPDREVDEDLPPFAKPYRKDGRWIYRPTRPRTFADMTRSPVHMEFFRRFLANHFAETPVLLWQAVENLKNTKDPRQRQQTVNQILRRYFFSKREWQDDVMTWKHFLHNWPFVRGIHPITKGFRELCCSSEVIQEIPKMDKVTPAMLISAQSCIGRDFEQRWFKIYQTTFPDTVDDDPSMEKDVAKTERTWGKQKTRNLWVEFVHRVMRFREGIMNERLFRQFCDYLRREAKKERERQRAMGNMTLGFGVPVRKVVRNKLVDMTKLVADVSFLAEGERYRGLCDNATEAAQTGIYRTGDQQLLELKGQTIVNCYFNSEVPPKIQINVSLELSERILQNFSNGLVDRSLFYSASMGVFSHIAYFWKKWQKHRIADMFMKQHEKSEQVLKTSKRPATPDYLNMKTDHVKYINVHEPNDEDSIRVLFSMSTGLRVLRPTQRERVTSAQIRTQQQMETYRSAMNKASTTDSKVKLEEKESRASLSSEEESQGDPYSSARFNARRRSSRRHSLAPPSAQLRMHRFSLGSSTPKDPPPRQRRLSLMPGLLPRN